jgi:hypothetical protein
LATDTRKQAKKASAAVQVKLGRTPPKRSRKVPAIVGGVAVAALAAGVVGVVLRRRSAAASIPVATAPPPIDPDPGLTVPPPATDLPLAEQSEPPAPNPPF